MTGRNKARSEGIEADSVQDAIAKLQALKKQREGDAAGNNVAGNTAAPRKPGRPPKAAQIKATESRAAHDLPAQALSLPAKPGRKPKISTLAADAAAPSFGVGKLTAHRPLGLLEVQEKADLDALLADPRLTGQIAMRLDDHFALVLPANLERLQAALLKVGHTPKLLGSKA
jgi:hypothetical protein